eukprot:899809-Amphidinium_carterae.1
MQEIAAIKDNRFGPAEIRDFRELFMGGVKERTRLTPDDLERMALGMTPLVCSSQFSRLQKTMF